jgi:hypothetical protein
MRAEFIRLFISFFSFLGSAVAVYLVNPQRDRGATMPQLATQTEVVAFDQWLAEIDFAITKEIAGCFPRDWDEDFITRSWLRTITQRFQEVSIADVDLPFTVSWDAYKATGAVETRYGDVGVIVNFHFRVADKSATATGVGFLEAKRLDAKSETYAYIKWDQLRHESANIAAHRVLLYDFENMEDAGLNLQSYGFCRHLETAPYGSVYAAVAVTQHVLAAQTKARAISSLGVPLGYQLCARYLRGLDLDYKLDPAHVLENIPGATRYLLVANVSSSDTLGKPSGTPIPLGYGPLEGGNLDVSAEDEPVVTAVAEATISPEGELADLIVPGRPVTRGDDEELELVAFSEA